MNDQAAQAGQRFRSLREMRDDHNRLLTAFRDRGEMAVDEVEAFVARGMATGEALELSPERFSAQSLLDYWSTMLFRAGREIPDVGLADFAHDRKQQLDDGACPYPGTEPFDGSRWRLFFGREAWIEAALGQLASTRVVALVGDVGSGKTSLIRAGLLPALAASPLGLESGLRYLPVVEPGPRPLEALASSITGSGSTPGETARLREGPDGLVRMLEERHRGPCVLAIDGLDELTSVCENADDRGAFLRNVLRLLETGGGHLVILSTHRDWMRETTAAPGTTPVEQSVRRELATRIEGARPRLAGGTRDLTLLSSGELRAAIESPAARVGLRFEEGLVDMMIGDYLGEPLGFLQLALLGLWEARRGTRVTREAYLRQGRGRVLVQSRAEELYASLAPPAQSRARSVLLELLPAGAEPGAVHARPRSRAALAEAAKDDPGHATVRTLARHGLIRESARAGGQDLVEVVHPSLASAWPRLAQWVQGRETEIERARAERESGLHRRATRFAAAFAVAFIAAAVLSWVSWSQLIRIGMLNAQKGAEDLRAPEPDRSLALAVWGLEHARSSPEDWQALLLASAYASNTRRVFRPEGEEGEIFAVAISPDGRLVLAGAPDGSVVVWDAESGETSGPPLRGHTRQVQGIAISADSRYVLTGSDDFRGILWDFAARREQRSLQLTDQVKAVALSADGTLALLGSRNPELWDLEKDEHSQLRGHKREVRAVAFVPSGGRPQRAVSGGEDNKVILWDLDNGLELRRMEDHERPVRAVAAGPDGCLVVSGSEDNSIIAWNTCNGDRTAYADHGDVATSVVFSADGRFVYSGSQDREIFVWEVVGGSSLRRAEHVLRGHGQHVLSLAFAAGASDGDTLVSGSQDGTVRLWDLRVGLPLWRFGDGRPQKLTAASLTEDQDGRTVRTIFDNGDLVSWRLDDGPGPPATIATDHSPKGPKPVFGHPDRLLRNTSNPSDLLLVTIPGRRPEPEFRIRNDQVVMAAALGRSGEWVLTADTRRALKLWQVGSDDAPRLFETRHTEDVKSVALSDDGTMAAAGSDDKTITLWNLRANEGILLEGNRAPVRALAFRPDHRQLASGSRDGTVILWDFTGREVGHFHGHRNEVRALAFDRQGELLVSASEDRSIILWHVASERPVHELRGHSDRVMGVELSADGRYAVSASADGTVVVWGLLAVPDFSSAALLDAVPRQRHTPALSKDDCRDFGLGRWPLTCP